MKTRRISKSKLPASPKIGDIVEFDGSRWRITGEVGWLFSQYWTAECLEKEATISQPFVGHCVVSPAYDPVPVASDPLSTLATFEAARSVLSQSEDSVSMPSAGPEPAPSASFDPVQLEAPDPAPSIDASPSVDSSPCFDSPPDSTSVC